jgi:sigma-B regulation protein RsbU (phosphoserine phosphatase)
MQEATNVLNEVSDSVEEGKKAGSRNGRIGVLIIEDNPGDARLIQMMLEESGGDLFEVEHVEELAAGFERLARGQVDVVLCDLSLPDSRGLETFALLHARAPHVPIIVLSGLNDTTVAVQAVHEGAQDYLIKGQVDGQLLGRAVRYAIERKRMSEQLARYADELRSKNAQLEADFNMAREIQHVFLPHQFPTFPHSVAPEQSALRFSQRYLPAAAVGGDFFDIFAITDTTAGIFICDVMGHGMRAALVTAIMRGLVEELMPVAADPGKFLTEINRSLHAILRRTREPFLATAFYLLVDVGSSEARFANAGHPSPFRVQRELGVAEPLKIYDPRHGPALGLFDKSNYPTCRCPMRANDLFLLFTDGLFELENASQEEYGQDRLLQAVRRRLALRMEQLFDELLSEVRRFSLADEFEDDVCLVGVEINRSAIPALPNGGIQTVAA